MMKPGHPFQEGHGVYVYICNDAILDSMQSPSLVWVPMTLDHGKEAGTAMTREVQSTPV